MIPQEYEDWREGGEDLRRELTHAVMRDLNCPDNWDMNGEYRSEFGAFSRYRSASRLHTVTIISPCAVPVISLRPDGGVCPRQWSSVLGYQHPV